MNTSGIAPGKHFAKICLLALSLAAGWHSANSARAASGDEHWDPQFGWPGTTNSVYGLGVHEGKVYAGGLYGTPAIVHTNFVEIWDGVRWSYMPDITGDLLVIYDFAWLGSDLYVAGIFTNVAGVKAVGLARWNALPGPTWVDSAARS